MAARQAQKCQMCDAELQLTPEGKYRPHLQLPLDGNGTERILIRFCYAGDTFTKRCLPCKLKAIVAAVALGAVQSTDDDPELFMACHSAMRGINKLAGDG